jgi:hypothetical protein
LKILSIALGVAMILVVLLDAFEAVILPRRVTRTFRLTRFFYRVTWKIWGAFVQWFILRRRREMFFSYFGPLSLLCLFACWALVLILGFALIQWGIGSAVVVEYGQGGFLTDLYLSGTTFFTLGLGDVVPRTDSARVGTVTEAGLGFGFLALLIGYLPVIYQSFSRREIYIALLDARAGSPPSAGELLRRHSVPGGAEALQLLLHEWERASADMLESHLSHSVLPFFRSQHNNQSWLMALTAILDACALLIAGQADIGIRQARLTFAGARHTVVDLAQIFSVPPKTMTQRLPHDKFLALRAGLVAAGMKFCEEKEFERRLTRMRRMYEPYVHAIGDYLRLSLPDWTKPPERKDNWETSGWDKVLRAAAVADEEAEFEEHF